MDYSLYHIFISHFEIAIYHCIMELFWEDENKAMNSIYIYMER